MIKYMCIYLAHCVVYCYIVNQPKVSKASYLMLPYYSPWGILQCFWPVLSDNWSGEPICGIFESGPFTQGLLYSKTALWAHKTRDLP